MAGFNQCEVLFEIDMTPNKLREIASEIEKLSKGELYLPGQVVRYKLNHKFCFVHKPETRTVPAVSFDTDDKVEPPVVETDILKTEGFGFFRN